MKDKPHILLVDDAQDSLRAKVLILLDICTGNNEAIHLVEGKADNENNPLLLPTASVDSAESIETVSIEQRPCWQFSDSTTLQLRSAAVIKQEVGEYLQLATSALGWTEHIPAVSHDIVSYACARIPLRSLSYWLNTFQLAD